MHVCVHVCVSVRVCVCVCVCVFWCVHKNITLSAYRHTTGGINVIFEVQAGDIPVANLQTALAADSFVSSFESSMAANGYTVTAAVVKEVDEPPASTEGAGGGAPAPQLAGANFGLARWPSALLGCAVSLAVVLLAYPGN